MKRPGETVSAYFCMKGDNQKWLHAECFKLQDILEKVKL